MKKRFLGLVLALVLFGSVPVYADTTFTDVQESDYFYVSVMVASEKGIINGVGNGEFKPYDTLTAAEAIKLSACIHANFYNADITPDTNPTHWADGYYNYAVENGIIKESDFAKVDFDKAITRDRLFYIFANTLPDSEYPEINDAGLAPEQVSNDYLKKLFCAGIVVGNEQGFESEKNITRADSVEIVLRMTAHSRRILVFEEGQTPPVYTPVIENEINQDVIAQEMLTLVNETREKNNMQSLTIHPELMRVAKILATEYSQGSYPHYLLDGRKDFYLAKDLGISISFETNYGKTALCQSSEFHSNVMKSEGRDSNANRVLFSEDKYYGVACIKGADENYYWVECFGMD